MTGQPPQTLSTILKPTEEEVGLRLDEFVTRHLDGFTKGEIVRAIERRNILLNERPGKKGIKLRSGDQVQIRDLSFNLVYPNPEVPVSCIWFDETLLALNKPAGIPTFPNRGYERKTLANGLVSAYPGQQGIGDSPLEAGILHRLDNGTSGLVIAARNQQTFQSMRRLFVERQVEKTYLALVHGVVAQSGRLENHLAHDPAHPGRMVIVQPETPHALYAVTRFRPLSCANGYTLLAVGIRTGVTHQIRCQLAAAGHPILGDARYAPKAGEPSFPGHCLHSYALAFQHPTTAQSVLLRAKILPPFLEEIRRIGVPYEQALVCLEAQFAPPKGNCV
ncbi:MAG: RluA family pseudouridine synthase [Kiritimatiellia bacterium]